MTVYVIIGLLVAAVAILNIVLRIEPKNNRPNPWIEPTKKGTNPDSKKYNPPPRLDENNL